jgi:excisionase family DNA binding protein
MTKTIAALASENPDIPQVALRPKEIAVMLNVSAMTVATYLRNGIIPARKLGGATVILRDEFLESLKSLPRAQYAPPVNRSAKVA